MNGRREYNSGKGSSSATMNRAVFLDRDGTIAEDVNYCSRAEDFQILPAVPDAIRILNETGFKTVLISNQSGLARGYFTEEILTQIHGKMERELAGYGAKIDAIYYCPHHPDDNCGCRKPKTGMIEQAAIDLDIDLKASYMIGDVQKDIDVGRAMGCRTILVTTGPGKGYDISDPADYTADSLMQAVTWIVKE